MHIPPLSNTRNNRSLPMSIRSGTMNPPIKLRAIGEILFIMIDPQKIFEGTAEVSKA